MARDVAERTAPPLVDVPRRGPAAAAGALAAVAALAASELAAGLLPGAPSLVEAVGARVIDSVPPVVKDAAIALFGTADKLALVVGIVLVALGAGALLGVAARTAFAVAVVGFLVVGVVGAAAALPEVEGTAAVAVVAIAAAVAVLAGLATLRRLLRAAPREPTGTEVPSPAAAGLIVPEAGPRSDRRAFLRLLAGVAAATVVTAGTGRLLLQRASAAAAREAVVLPPPARALPPPPAGASLAVEGISPLLTPNDRFYRIDTALSVPQVDPQSWRLRITGMVERELELGYDDLLARPLVERDVTLACVSNAVGGDLVGTARWTGVSLRQLLEEAGVAAGAEQVIGRSVDGFTAGFPVSAVFDGREPLVAVGMNGDVLPLRHGFPARLIVPGLYGYVSATKWLAEIEVTTWDVEGYWVPRGWAREAPIKTQSRIDVPAAGATLAAGRVPIAGVAWAPRRGIERVEVRIDDGRWLEARLSEPLSDDTWRQWLVEWDATPGRHTIAVRATDATGRPQTERRVPPAPDGASGWHTITVEVTA